MALMSAMSRSMDQALSAMVFLPLMSPVSKTPSISRLFKPVPGLFHQPYGLSEVDVIAHDGLLSLKKVMRPGAESPYRMMLNLMMSVRGL